MKNHNQTENERLLKIESEIRVLRNIMSSVLEQIGSRSTVEVTN